MKSQKNGITLVRYFCLLLNERVEANSLDVPLRMEETPDQPAQPPTHQVCRKKESTIERWS